MEAFLLDKPGGRLVEDSRHPARQMTANSRASARAFVSRGCLINMGTSLSAVSLKTGEKSGRNRDRRLENDGGEIGARIKVDQSQSNQIKAKMGGVRGHFGIWVRRLENEFWDEVRSDKELASRLNSRRSFSAARAMSCCCVKAPSAAASSAGLISTAPWSREHGRMKGLRRPANKRWVSPASLFFSVTSVPLWFLRLHRSS